MIIIIFLSVEREWRKHVVSVYILSIAVGTLLHKLGQNDLGDKKEMLKMYFTAVSPRL